MNGNIAFANPALARYAVSTDGGDHTLFELRGRGELREGERLSGEFHAGILAARVPRSEGSDFMRLS